ncbi:MAG: tetratricopeptide repeat protein, partial [Planctomycetales bacterium]
TRLLTEHAEHELAADSHYARARARRLLKKYDESIADIQEFLKSKPEKKEACDAQYLLGLCQVGQEKFKEAAATLDALVQDAECAAEDKVFYELGWAYKSLDDQENAAKTFQALSEKHPGSGFAPEALHHVGESHYDAKDFEEAVKWYQQAAEKAKKPDVGEKAAHKLGWAFYRLDDFEKGAAQFDAQIKKFPEGSLASDGQFMNGECLFKTKMHAPALAAYDKAIAGFEKAGEAANPAFFQLALLHGAQSAGKIKPPNWKRSLELVGQLLTKHPESTHLSEAHYEQGWALQNTKMTDPALASYEKSTDAGTGEPAARAWFMRGQIYFGKKEHGEAVKNFIRASLYPYPEVAANSLFEAGRCLEVLKKPEQALKTYKELVAKYADSDQVAPAQARIKALGG